MLALLYTYVLYMMHLTYVLLMIMHTHTHMRSLTLTHVLDELKSFFPSPPWPGVYYLASASRDRMVHIFTNNETKGYEPIQSLPDHSASVTSISFVRSTDQKLQLLSCGADKSILYHVLDKLVCKLHKWLPAVAFHYHTYICTNKRGVCKIVLTCLNLN